MNKYGFNPSCDRSDIDQFGFINLRDAYENGSVDGAMAFEQEKYNGVSDPSVLLPRPRDQFEALRQTDYVRSVLKSAAEAEAKQQPSEG